MGDLSSLAPLTTMAFSVWRGPSSQGLHTRKSTSSLFGQNHINSSSPRTIIFPPAKPTHTVSRAGIMEVTIMSSSLHGPIISLCFQNIHIKHMIPLGGTPTHWCSSSVGTPHNGFICRHPELANIGGKGGSRPPPPHPLPNHCHCKCSAHLESVMREMNSEQEKLETGTGF